MTVAQHQVRCGAENWVRKKGPMSRITLEEGCGWSGKRSAKDAETASDKPCPGCGGVVWAPMPKVQRVREDKAQQKELARSTT